MTALEENKLQPLTEKYRPNSFDEVVGNAAVVERLRVSTTAMKGRVKNFLIIGPSGCGKTTLAEIVPKELDIKGLNIIRINAATFRGIDTVRQIADKMRYAGTRLWFVDEAHCMLPDAQDGLLKPLEDTISDTYFIFCTTEPDRLRVPLKGRCEKLIVRPLKHDESLELIDRICDGESKQLSSEIKNIVSNVSEGIPREIVANTGRAINDPYFLENLENMGSISLFDSPDNFIMPFREFDGLELPERKMIMPPLLKEGDLAMLAGASGTAKTLLAMEITGACSTGRKAMDGLWVPEKAHQTLYIDGEMHWDDIKTRGRAMGLHDAFILSRTAYHYMNGTPPINIADEKIQRFLSDYIAKKGIKLVVLDNVDSLVDGLDHSSALQWGPIRRWLWTLRSQGVCVILVHHTNRKGRPLGTSTREFNLDYTLILQRKRPHVKTSSMMCAFSIEVDKVRGSSQGLEGKLFVCEDGKWDVSDLEESDEKTQRGRKKDISSQKRKARIALRLVAGDKQKDIAEMEEVTPPHVTYVKQALIREGKLRESEDTECVEFTASGRKWVEELLPDSQATIK
jgi:Cdc6-like AAA superfamily ATPase